MSDDAFERYMCDAELARAEWRGGGDADEREYFTAHRTQLRASVEAAARAAIMAAERARNELLNVALDARQVCSIATCRGTAFRFALVSIAADSMLVAAANDRFALAPNIEFDERRVHVCIDGVCPRAAACEHTDLHDRVVAMGIALYAASRELYWCRAHERAHVCDDACTQSFVDTRGVRRCVLSARLIGTADQAAYGDGTTDALALAQPSQSSVAYDATHQRRRRRRTRTTTNAPLAIASGESGPLVALGKRARSSSSAAAQSSLGLNTSSSLDADQFLSSSLSTGQSLSSSSFGPKKSSSTSAATLDVGHSETSSTTRSNNTRALDAEHSSDKAHALNNAYANVVDWSSPDRVRFANLASENTFGNDIGAALDQYYRAAHATVDRLLFSDERIAVEQRRRDRVFERAHRIIESYVADQARNDVVVADTIRAIGERALARTRLLPCVVLPRGGLARATAYYALVMLEFYVNVRALARAVELAAASSGYARRYDPSTASSSSSLSSSSSSSSFSSSSSSLFSSSSLSSSTSSPTTSFSSSSSSSASMSRDDDSGATQSRTLAEAIMFAATEAQVVATRVQALSVPYVVACALDLLQRGYHEGSTTIFERDRIVATLFYESDVLRDLVMPEKTATTVMSNIKQVIAAARDLGLSMLRRMQATQLSFAEVYESRAPVIDVFLARRRARQ